MFAFLFTTCLLGADPAPQSAKDAFQPLNPLIGAWKGTGYPDGTRTERQKGFWAETLTWEWRFDQSDVRLTAAIDKGKHFTRWDLRYLPGKKVYQLTAVTPDRETLLFTGVLGSGKQKEQVLTLERTDSARKEDQRLVVTLLHHNRFLYRWETRPAGAGAFTRKYQVGATKEGEPFADVPKGPECVVSGGKGTIAVSHKGKTYHVCCSGCRDEFRADPEKYVREYEAKKK
ncbi:MAG TPA: YHS domain-containing protein [Fimbriiglobus sp.]|jgi:YHS domain-containing protein|nr:YHS domain-containing protein [Fimbriiglobus sp.]